MIVQDIPADFILFFVLYGISGVVPFIAAVYLLLRKGNAFAPNTTPPVRLRRWATSFFFVSSLGHLWWFLFFIYSGDVHSICYVAVTMFDCVALLTTMAGTLLTMLQDRRRPVWPAIVAMIPFSVLAVLQMIYPESSFIMIGTIYILSVYVLFSVYMAYAVRQYGRWLNDNYADLENKKVWLSQVVSLVCLLLFILYELVDVDSILIYLLHFWELLLFFLLLWRVETLPQLGSIPVEESCTTSETEEETVELEPLEVHPLPTISNIDLDLIERLLTEHCVGTQLYLQHDLTLQQLAQTVGTNRYYLSQYFSRQGITYNTYINNMRINHFISLYEMATAKGNPVVAQQLASESGYRSYSTFSLAFKQRTGQSVTAWVRKSTK